MVGASQLILLGATTIAAATAASGPSAVFSARSRAIEAHNARFEAGLESYRMVHNKFSQMSAAELRRFTGELPADAGDDDLAAAGNATARLAGIQDDLDGKKAPAHADYRHLCSAVRNQDTCGSCYAFASAAAMEVHLRLKKVLREDVSEQDIIDCSTASHGNNGCDGGNTMKVFRYINEKGFVTKRSVYPYENKVGKCRSQPAHSAGTVDGYELIYGARTSKEDKMAVIVGLDGPVTVMLQYMPESFYHYGGGIYDDVKCGQLDPENPVGHAVTIVGYGSEGRKDFWIIRNSWGAEWGEQGYVRMARGKDMCRLTTKVVLPVVTK